MDTCAFFWPCDIVVDVDNDLVPPVGLYERPGEGIVDKQHRPIVSIGGDDAAADGEIVCPDDACIGIVDVRVGVPVVQFPPRITVRQGVVSEENREEGKPQGPQN